MKELFVPFDLCKRLIEELGYDEGSLGEYYNEELYIPSYNGMSPCFSNVDAILWDQAFIFIAKKYDIHGHVDTKVENLYERRVELLKTMFRYKESLKL